ncbi:MAG: proteasome accessory factor [Actinomycetota bacterium]
MPPNTDKRLARLLALVPWVAAQDGPAIEEVCERFGCTEEQLVEDLERLFLCGLYPFTPDTLIEVDIAEGRVWIRFAEVFARPLRLTPAEGLAVVAAGAALLTSPVTTDSEPLARGLAKLAAVLGVDADEMVEVELGSAPAGLLAELQRAEAEHRQAEVEYYSYGRDTWTRRVIDPHRVFGSAGQWYVAAYCHRVDDDRLFRVDRMRAVTVLDSSFKPRKAAPAAQVFSPRPDDPTVVLELASSARWVLEAYPHEKVQERRGGKVRVTLRVSERGWLERLLLRLGPDAEVVAGEQDVGRGAARRLLQRYEEHPVT